ncbi:MAG TPA: class I SAM-dependent methyltransferase [Streptosporangiaceae bacterium]|jgi:SAM-dependent methyltransferase
MPQDRDVEAFAERAPGYEEGWLGRLHHEIADRTVRLALAAGAAPGRGPSVRPGEYRVLDVGCGTGYLLRRLAVRCPEASLDGIDAAPPMIAAAEAAAAADPATGGRLRFRVGTAERLTWPSATFDLVVSTTSFDHWADQRAGLAECARVLAPGGRLVLVDQFSVLLPAIAGGRRGKARTKRRASRLLTEAGFGSLRWHTLYAVIIAAVTAEKAT